MRAHRDTCEPLPTIRSELKMEFSERTMDQEVHKDMMRRMGKRTAQVGSRRQAVWLVKLRQDRHIWVEGKSGLMRQLDARGGPPRPPKLRDHSFLWATRLDTWDPHTLPVPHTCWNVKLVSSNSIYY